MFTVRANGLLQGRFTHKGKTYSAYGRTEQEVREKLELKKAEVLGGVHDIKFSAYAGIWLEHLQVKQNTKENYGRLLDRHIFPEIGSYKVNDINALMIKNILYSRSAYSDSTLMLLHSILSGIFKSAYNDGLTGENIMDRVPVIKGSGKHKGKSLTEKEYRILMEEAGKTDLPALIRFVALTGLRSGEARALTWSAVNLAEKYIHVKNTYTNGKISGTKTESGNRYVPLSADAVKILMSLPKGGVFVFGLVSDGKLHWEIERLNRLCKQRDGSFPDFSIHTLRHTFATICANNGMIPKVLMSVMGHKSISMTMDYYAHADIDRSIEELRKVEGAF